ncbi:MAG: PQQ-binding-like beta-propeller repeat protein [Verrucomicrobiales bacterium]
MESGAILHQIDLFQRELAAQPRRNSFASPTPVAEAGKVWVHFGGYGTACLDAETGQVLWRRDPFAHDHEHATGSSPILYGDLLIAHFDGADERFVAAFDKRTGDLAWRAERSADVARRRYAFSTPLVIDHDGAPQLISPASGQVSAYDPLTGEEIWRVRHDGYSAVPRPVAGFGRVFAITGYIKPHLLAIDPGGRGDVTDTRVAWVSHDRVPANPSPLLVGDRLFLITDFGIASWVDADTGESLWCERLGGRHFASPLHAQGRIYTFDTDGTTHVLAAADAFRELAANRLDGGIRASPAVAGETLILRTDTHLYRIGQSGGSEGQ